VLRGLIAIVVSVAVGVVGIVALSRGRDDGPAKPLTQGQLYRLQDRINAAIPELAREGVLAVVTGQGGRRGQPCVDVSFANPTVPNVAYLRRRFGPGTCVARQPNGRAVACAEMFIRPRAARPVSVPDLRGLGLYEAERRVTEAGLTYALDCVGDATSKPRRPARESPEALARVTRQCPRPGAHVPLGTEIALQGIAPLPGGVDYPLGVEDEDPPFCADGSHV
jgi:hypothetical protein